MNAVTPHAFTDYMYFLHYLHVLHGERFFLILSILYIPVKIQISIRLVKYCCEFSSNR